MIACVFQIFVPKNWKFIHSRVSVANLVQTVREERRDLLVLLV